MTDEVIRLRRTTEAGWPGGTPIARPPAETGTELTPASVRRTDALAAPDSVDEGSPRSVIDSLQR